MQVKSSGIDQKKNVIPVTIMENNKIKREKIGMNILCFRTLNKWCYQNLINGIGVMQTILYFYVWLSPLGLNIDGH